MLILVFNDDKGTRCLVVEPEDVVVDADVIELDQRLDLPKDPKHFTRSVSACLQTRIKIHTVDFLLAPYPTRKFPSHPIPSIHL